MLSRTELHRIDMPAILDMKWSVKRRKPIVSLKIICAFRSVMNGQDVLAVACAAGLLSLYVWTAELSVSCRAVPQLM